MLRRRACPLWHWAQLFVAVACGGATAALAAPARAQSNAAVARALFREGHRLMGVKDYERACPKLAESQRLDEDIDTQFELAHCWEQLGRTASAWAQFLDVAAAARAVQQSQREADARKRADDLEPKLSRLNIVVEQAPRDLAITRNDQLVGKAAWGTPMPVDPGQYRVVAQAPGKLSWTTEVEVPGAPQVVSVQVPELSDSGKSPSDESAAGKESSTLRQDTGGSNGQKVAAIVIGGVGAAALAMGTVFALQSRSDNDEALSLCRDVRDPVTGQWGCASLGEEQQQNEAVRRADENRTLGFLGFGVGTVGLVTAAILYWTADEPAEAAQLEFTPVLGASTWGARVGGRF